MPPVFRPNVSTSWTAKRVCRWSSTHCPRVLYSSLGLEDAIFAILPSLPWLIEFRRGCTYACRETHVAALLDEEAVGGYVRCCGRAACAVDVSISFYLLHLTPLRPVSIRRPSTLDDLLPRALTRSREPTRHTLSAALLALSSSKTRSRPFRSSAPAASGPVASCARRRAYPALYLSRQPNSYLGGRVHTCRCLDAGDKEGSGAEWSEENVSDAAAGVEPVETLLSRSHGRTFGNNDGPHPRRSAVDSNSVPAAQARFRFAAYGWRAVLRLAARARLHVDSASLHASDRRTFEFGRARARPAMGARYIGSSVCGSDVGFAGSEPEDDHGRWSSSARRRTYSFTKTHEGGGQCAVYCDLPARSYTQSLQRTSTSTPASTFYAHLFCVLHPASPCAAPIRTPLRRRSLPLVLADFASPPRSLLDPVGRTPCQAGLVSRTLHCRRLSSRDPVDPRYPMPAACLDSLPISLGASPRRRKRGEPGGEHCDLPNEEGYTGSCRNGEDAASLTAHAAGPRYCAVCPPDIQASIVDYAPERAFASTSTSHTCFRTFHAIVNHYRQIFVWHQPTKYASPRGLFRLPLRRDETPTISTRNDTEALLGCTVLAEWDAIPLSVHHRFRQRIHRGDRRTQVELHDPPYLRRAHDADPPIRLPSGSLSFHVCLYVDPCTSELSKVT
ncbi:hypothetical protein MSAN_00135300 [Mycena sanguinolenta]|uniref:Uncharacterized protein n=1 Tax=Mycena sanguinolenta TaxID=230812 RepID=A0A8H6ZHU8_9AGAR|nr:hypothetical protein MSAN_00135300 [Mycena sanguinolenta]